MSALSPTQRKAVCDLWDEIEARSSSASTERLMALVVEEARHMGYSIDEGDVSAALYQREQRRGQR